MSGKVQALDGFLLSRQGQDQPVPSHLGSRQPKRLVLEFWFSSKSGPIKVTVDNSHSVFFVESVFAEKAAEICAGLVRTSGYSADSLFFWRELALKNFHHNKVAAFYFAQQQLMYRAREAILAENIVPYEGDIAATERFLMERFVTGAANISGEFIPHENFLECVNPKFSSASYQPELKVVSLDIETSMRGENLFSIAVVGGTFHSSKEGEARYTDGDKRVFMWRDAAEPSSQPLSDQATLHWCQSQKHVLQNFLDWFHRFDPDIIIGWSVVQFDLAFLQRRADAWGMALSMGRGGRPLHWRGGTSKEARAKNTGGSQSLDDVLSFADGSNRLTIAGRAVLDGIETLKSATYSFESFSLNNVASEVLKRGKLIENNENRGVEIGRLFRDDKPALARYNLEDCQLVWEIFQCCELMEFAVERAQLTGLSIDRFGGSVASFDNRYLPRLHRAGFVAPVLKDDSDTLGSPGGFVMESEPGIYKNVLVLDFKSLYPSIIRTFKIDPLARVMAQERLRQESLDTRESLSRDQLEKLALVPGFHDAFFSRHPSILPDIIAELTQARERAKQSGRKAMSQAIKILMNSFYGVLGTPGCRFFDYRLPSSITLRGHALLNATKELIEQKGHRVIYGDTDSVFVWLQNDELNSEDANEAGKDLAECINEHWKNALESCYGIESHLEIEFETHFLKFVMPTIRGSEKGSKKRYAGLALDEKTKECNMVFKGLEAVRSDWTPYARNFQRELYKRIFYQQSYAEFIRESVAAIRAGKEDAHLYYRKRLRRSLDSYVRNVPPHVQAARLAEAASKGAGLNQLFRRGGWIEYALTKNGPEPKDYQRSPMDYELYIDRQIKPIVDGIAHFLDSSFEDIVGAQMGLF